jgi:hypothetical protein
MLQRLITLPNPAIGLWKPERPGAKESKLEISVIFTSFDSTQVALRRAETLARRLDAGVTLVVIQVVPYPLPLDKPPVPLGFIIRRFEAIVSESPVKTEISVFLCRDQKIALKRALRPKSLVVLGIRKRWWPTREKRLVCLLRRAGHEVILVEME